MKRRFTTAIIAALLCAAVLFQAVPAGAWKADNVVYANADPNLYEIEVDLVNQIVTVTNTTDGSIALQAICTTGAESTPTPTGSWRLNTTRRRFGYFSEYDCYAQYWVNVIGGIYFHSILYTRPVEGYFTRTSYNNLGSVASHGCIRMLVEDIRWIYYNCPPGTLVTITDDKPKDEELRQSLLPKVSYRDYEPEPDLYEATDREEAQGVAKRGSVLTDSAGGFVSTVDRGEFFQILYPGPTTTRVRLDSGAVGYIDTDRILFLPNGPDDLYYAASCETTAFKDPSNISQALETIEEGEKLEILGETENFYKVALAEGSGYVLKRDVDLRSNVIDDIDSLLDSDKDADKITFTVLRVKEESAAVYVRPSNISQEVVTLGEGTDLTVLSETENFYRVRAGGYTGYILKRDCVRVRLTVKAGQGYTPQLTVIE